MRFARGSAADEAGLGRDELAMLLVAKANGLGLDVTLIVVSPLPRTTGTASDFSSLSKKGIFADAATLCVGASCNCCSSIAEVELDHRKSVAEVRLNEVRIGREQRILGGQVPVDPVRGLIFRLESGDLRNQLFSHGR